MTIVSTAILVLALVLCVVVVSQILSQGYVSLCGYSLFRVVTPSMEPTIPVGSLLISEDVPIEEIQVDDFVVFRSKSSDMLGGIITHRVINIIEGQDGQIYLETKGDANQYPDASYVEQRNLIGRVNSYTGEGNFFSGLVDMVTSPMGFFAGIVIPCLIIGVLIMRSTISSIRKEMESLNQELEEQKHLEIPVNNPSQQTEPETEQMGAAEYQELCDRLRAELLEELKQSAVQEETTE